jgi:hypothetical protein
MKCCSQCLTLKISLEATFIAQLIFPLHIHDLMFLKWNLTGDIVLAIIFFLLYFFLCFPRKQVNEAQL